MKRLTTRVAFIIWSIALILPLALYPANSYLLAHGIDPNTLVGTIVLVTSGLTYYLYKNIKITEEEKNNTTGEKVEKG